MKHIFILITAIIVLSSCSTGENEPSPEQKQEQAQLNSTLATLKRYEPKTCDDIVASDKDNIWHFIGAGENPCGGTDIYIGYPSSIDFEVFSEEVAKYTEAEKQFNLKWNISKTCVTTKKPVGFKCEDDQPTPVILPDDQMEELHALEKTLKELQQLVDVPCTDASIWEFIAVGSKACGGPQLYMAYPNTIDTERFLAKVTAYTNAEKAYNEKWNIFSTCEFLTAPGHVECYDGKAVLIYPAFEE